MSRYDKVYLARFSERAPLTIGPDWLRHIATFISAPRAVQPMFAGALADLRPFPAQLGEHRLARRQGCDRAVHHANLFGKHRSGGHGPHDSRIVDQPASRPTSSPTSATMVGSPRRKSISICRRPFFAASRTGCRWFAARTPASARSSTRPDECKKRSRPNTAGFAVGRIDLDGRHTFYTTLRRCIPDRVRDVIARGERLLFGSLADACVRKTTQAYQKERKSYAADVVADCCFQSENARSDVSTVATPFSSTRFRRSIENVTICAAHGWCCSVYAHHFHRLIRFWPFLPIRCRMPIGDLKKGQPARQLRRATSTMPCRIPSMQTTCRAYDAGTTPDYTTIVAPTPLKSGLANNLALSFYDTRRLVYTNRHGTRTSTTA